MPRKPNETSVPGHEVLDDILAAAALTICLHRWLVFHFWLLWPLKQPVLDVLLELLVVHVELGTVEWRVWLLAEYLPHELLVPFLVSVSVGGLLSTQAKARCPLLQTHILVA